MSNEDNINAQKALIAQLEAEQRDKAAGTAFLVAHQEDDAYVAHPGFQHTYKWVGNRLVKMDGIEVPDLYGAAKAAWKDTWGKLFTKKFWGLGQAPAVKDGWGVKTYGFPIAVRQEVELEEELKRIHQAEAPYADEFMHGLTGSTCVHVFRVDNLASGDPRYPVYAIPYKDKFGTTQIVTYHKRPDLAVEQFKQVQGQGRVAAVLDDFDEKAFGYDMKMLLYSPCI
jgi:hypothetical protein